ncbi:MAG: hypothetical protein WC606_04295 [Candidatus Absconditabacterales bacterium]
MTENTDENKNIKKEKYFSVVKKIRNGLLITLISALPLTKNLQAQNNDLLQSIGGKKAMKAQKEVKNEKNQDSLQFERQKTHFDVIDKRDLMRDIIAIYHDKETDTYWKRNVHKNVKNRLGEREKITKKQFDTPQTLQTKYKTYPPEHILIVDKKYNHINYKKAKKILDKQRIQERIKHNKKI